MNTAHRIETNANTKQRTCFARAAGKARFSYNWALAEWKKEYEAGRNHTEAARRRKLNTIKQSEFPWILDVIKMLHRRPSGSLVVLSSAFIKAQPGIISIVPTIRNVSATSDLDVILDFYIRQEKRSIAPHHWLEPSTK